MYGSAAAQKAKRRTHSRPELSEEQKQEIKEAFALFAEPMDGEKEGVIPTGDVRRAMV